MMGCVPTASFPVMVVTRNLDAARTNVMFGINALGDAALLGGRPSPGGNRQERRKRRKAERDARKRGR